MTAVKPPPSGLVVIVLRLLFSMLQTYLCASRNPKTYFVFTLNSIYPMFSKLFDSQDLTSHLIFVKSCPTGSLCFYGQKNSKILQNLRIVGPIEFWKGCKIYLFKKKFSGGWRGGRVYFATSPHF